MPNTKAVGVAYADPQFDNVTVTGASAFAAVTATTVSASGVLTAAAVGAGSFTSSGVNVISNAVAGLYFVIVVVSRHRENYCLCQKNGGQQRDCPQKQRVPRY